MSLTHQNEFEHQLEEQRLRRELWGWTLPFTQHVLTSFDILSELLSPHHPVRVPGSSLKIEGEIRPRSKSLQQVVRSVMFFEGDDEAMREISRKMQNLDLFLKDFLDQGDVKGLLGSRVDRCREGDGEGGEGYGNRGGSGGLRIRGENESEREMRRRMIFEKRIGSVELKRRKDALSGEKRENVLRLMRDLEVEIEGDLRGVEDAMWPRKIIKFGSTASSEREEEYDQESRYWIVRARVWICELAEEIWQDGGEILRCVLRAGWNILLVWKVQVWGAVLVGGAASVVAYLHG